MVIGVNGIQLYYTKTGQGRPLIMVHGNGEDHTITERITRSLMRQSGFSRSILPATASIPGDTDRAVTAGNCTIRTWLRI